MVWTPPPQTASYCARLVVRFNQSNEKEESARKITRIGIDLAKNVFQVHGVDSHGKTALQKQLSRAKVLEFFARLEPALIGMEACTGAHY
jgi:hypothetical protein